MHHTRRADWFSQELSKLQGTIFEPIIPLLQSIYEEARRADDAIQDTLSRLDRLEESLKELHNKVDQINARFSGLESRLDESLDRLDKVESDLEQVKEEM